MPKVNLEVAPRIFAAVHDAIAAGLVRACHDLSEGGLGVAAAEMAFAGERGLRLDLAAVARPAGLDDDTTLLFSESPTRLLVEVPPADAQAFEAKLDSLPFSRVGEVIEDTQLIITGVAGGEALRASLAELKAAWQSTTVV